MKGRRRTPKRICVLGSTGSIGTQALDLVAAHPDRFRVTGLAGGQNVDLLAAQARRFGPEVVALTHASDARRLKKLLAGSGVRVSHGPDGAREVAAGIPADIVLSAFAGLAGLEPTAAALRAGRDLALANKESLVAGGRILTREAARTGARILPVDSEHCAIFQALLGHDRGHVRRLILTASGGPFLAVPREALSRVTPEKALNHPTWRMGRKVTVDSATLMNKGFEVIEAMWLFGIPAERIEILIHRQSVIHSMVEYIDGSVVAQMGIADMHVPIAYALSYPDRLPLDLPPLRLSETRELTFERPDPDRFPAYTLAYEAAKMGGTAPAVLCEADEVAVEAFLTGALPFVSIASVMSEVLSAHSPVPADSLDAIRAATEWARKKAEEIVRKV
ncbi:MAG: 1-deoxy-D-xylulose-5-phosphate reductoisomerase [Deltaproteobacteria bacterium]|nr:1-deoxy-D-xylulose-5-phosphate reductoisomerase [Deltaproteobacteria bacterium]